MSFRRQSLLKKDVEEELKEKFSELWLSEDPKYSGKEIAKKLQFGVIDSPSEKVKPEYIFFFRQKFELPLRKKPSFGATEEAIKLGLRKSRYKVLPEDLGIMPIKEFVDTLNKNLPNIDSFYYRRARTFLIMLYWTPLRSSEIYERTIDDFEITKDEIIIHLLRKKKNHEPDDKDEPVEINRTFPLVEELVDWLRGKEWEIELRKKGKFVRDKKGKVVMNKRPWNINHNTALNYVKEFNLRAYPHYFRFQYLTSGANNKDITIAELKTKSRLTLPALEHYLMAPRKLEQSYNRKILKKLREEGAIKEEVKKNAKPI